MYRLKFNDLTKEYEIHSRNGGAFACKSLAQICHKAIELGVQEKEITFACQQMAKNKHKISEFGIRGCFLYSHNGKD